MVKRITNRYINIGLIIASILIIKVVVILTALITAHIAEGRNCELFKMFFNSEFLDFIERNKFLRNYFSIFALIIGIIAGVSLVLTLLLARDLFNLDYKRNHYFNFLNWRLFSGPVTGRERLNFYYRPKATIFLSIILPVLWRCILLFVMTLLVLNIVHYYFGKNILSFNIIHKSILDNKIAMGAIAALVTICAACLLWSIICKVINKLKIFHSVNQKKNEIVQALTQHNSIYENMDERLRLRNIQEKDKIIIRDEEMTSKNKVELLLYNKGQYFARKLPINGKEYSGEGSSSWGRGYSCDQRDSYNSDIRSVLAPINIFVSHLPTAVDLCFWTLDKIPCTKFLFSDSSFAGEDIDQKYNAI
jgi:hypothetical protein